MAVTATNISSDLILIMDNGTGANGQPLSKSRTYRNVKTTATDSDVYDVAQSLIGLQSRTNQSIQRRNILEIESE